MARKKTGPRTPYITLRPSSHEAWLEERKNGVGASSVGKLLGVSKYGTPYSLWRDLIGLNPPVEENWAMVQGHIYESYIADRFQAELGYSVIKASSGDWIAVNPYKSFLRVSPDWTFWLSRAPRTISNKGVLECKSTRLNVTKENWREVHLDWYCQIQYQLYVLDLEVGYLGCLNTQTGEYFFDEVIINYDLCVNTLVPAIEKFWNENVCPARQYIEEHGTTNIAELHQFAPPATEASDIDEMYASEESGKSIEATTLDSPYADPIEDGADIPDFFDALSLYKQRKAQIKALEEDCKTFENWCKLKMADAEFIAGADGKPLATYKANKSSMKFDEKRFKEEHPDIYSKYLNEKPGARIFKVK